MAVTGCVESVSGARGPVVCAGWGARLADLGGFDPFWCIRIANPPCVYADRAAIHNARYRRPRKYAPFYAYQSYTMRGP